jgi:hypothetical protein
MKQQQTIASDNQLPSTGDTAMKTKTNTKAGIQFLSVQSVNHNENMKVRSGVTPGINYVDVPILWPTPGKH